MTPTVAVIGGGYGGASVAAHLDDAADVVLVGPRDAFAHTVASLRSLTDPAWVESIFLAYERLLPRGRVVRDRSETVDSRGAVLASGERITADYTVLATGSAYPFPAKFAEHDSDRAKAPHSRRPQRTRRIRKRPAAGRRRGRARTGG